MSNISSLKENIVSYIPTVEITTKNVSGADWFTVIQSIKPYRYGYVA